MASQGKRRVSAAHVRRFAGAIRKGDTEAMEKIAADAGPAICTTALVCCRVADSHSMPHHPLP